ncbi:MAG TPA: NAD(P)H-binding protein [Sphingomonadaceae bacterium]|nr:NAD(P)H-binding protein [Sphingomonadaceae bacterium]
MKIAVVGATGNAGSHIVKELVARGHTVTAISRHAEKVAGPGVTTQSIDVADGAALAKALEGHDAVVSAVRFVAADAAGLIDAVKRSGVRRYLVVGGASSLFTPGTTERRLDRPDFPDTYRAEATAGADFLALLRAEKTLDWVSLAPSTLFMGTERRGTFRLGKDELLIAADGTSAISFPDYAIALADEIEAPKYHQDRFTVGY